MAHPFPHHEHHPPGGYGPSDLPQGILVKIICKANKTYNLSVRNDNPVLAPADSEDATQLWIKDCSYGERTKDNYGSPAFALINKSTRKILKHSKEKGHQVILVDYRPGVLDEDLLWTESDDFGEGFRTVRMASDTLLNMTLFHKEEKKSFFHLGAEKSADEVKEGTPIVLDTWHKNDLQLWKIFPL